MKRSADGEAGGAAKRANGGGSGAASSGAANGGAANGGAAGGADADAAAMKEKEGRIATLQAAANSHFRAGEREEALKLFTEAIALCDAPPKLPVPIQIYSNRSAVFALLTRYEEALQDAVATVQLNPTWARGHSRRRRQRAARPLPWRCQPLG